MPTEELLTVPEEWLLHRCPHKPDGFRLQLVPEHHDEKEMAAEQSVWGVSVWRDSIDATKTLAIPGVNPESTVLTPHTTLSTTNPIHSQCGAHGANRAPGTIQNQPQSKASSSYRWPAGFFFPLNVISPHVFCKEVRSRRRKGEQVQLSWTESHPNLCVRRSRFEASAQFCSASFQFVWNVGGNACGGVYFRGYFPFWL
jgi:hypothetical protein